MGFFTKDGPGGEALAPLSAERIKAALDDAGWKYEVGPDGEIGGGWEAGVFLFNIMGESEELLGVRGYWFGRLDDAEYPKALEVANEWNAERIWPKAYVARDQEGKVRLNVEHNVDYEHGLTDDQLALHLVCAVNTGIGFFEHLNVTFPEAWAAVEAEDAQ